MRIAVVGNCHADIVVQAVRHALRDVPGLDCRHIVSYRSATEADQAFIDSADRLLTQVADFKSRGEAAGKLGERSERVGLFPLIAGNFIYPYSGKAHPRAAESRSVFCPSGYYEGQVSDSMLVDLMEKHAGEPVEAIVDRYLALDYASLLDLDRLFDINRMKMQRIGQAAGLDLWPKIERSFRDVPVFLTYLHPTGVMMRDLCRHALGQLNLGLDRVAIEAAIQCVKEPFGFAHMPIHPSIVRHFGIEWAGEDFRYRFMPEGAFTIRAFAERFVRFEHNDMLNQAIYNLHNNLELDAAVATLEQARAQAADNGDILINLAIGYWKQGRLAQSMEASVAALESNPRQSEWAEFLCIVARQSGLAAPVLPA